MESVESMSRMFHNATVFNQIIELKQLRSLRSAEGIFIGAHAFNKDWEWRKVTKLLDQEVRRQILAQVRER